MSYGTELDLIKQIFNRAYNPYAVIIFFKLTSVVQDN